MKSMPIVAAVIAILVMSCSHANYTKRVVPIEMVFGTDAVALYADSLGEKGSVIDTIKNMKGSKVISDKSGMTDEFVAIGTPRKIRTFNRFKWQGRDVWASSSDVNTEATFDCLSSNAVVKVPRDRSDEAWSRAAVWISRHSDMKVQSSSDYTIETYNPTKPGLYGYNATRMIQGGEVIISLERTSSVGRYASSDCSFFSFVKYGTEQ